MAVTSGLTTFGIVRKRMADLALDFARRIKEGGAFGVLTTVDNPDSYPSDPLVQIMATTTASTAELWEAVELWYNQLNPETASGVYLDNFHGKRLGIVRSQGQSDDDFRKAILTALRDRPTTFSPVTTAISRGDVECADIIFSTQEDEIPGVPEGGAMFIVKGCNVDWASLADDIYANNELGLYKFYGDKVVKKEGTSCLTYVFQEAQPLPIAVDIEGYFLMDCGENDSTQIRLAIAESLNTRQCQFGGNYSTAPIASAIAKVGGFVPTRIRLARRGRLLVPQDCEGDEVITVSYCGQELPWTTKDVCAGEIWCEADSECIKLAHHEFPLFDPRFLTITEVPSTCESTG